MTDLIIKKKNIPDIVRILLLGEDDKAPLLQRAFRNDEWPFILLAMVNLGVDSLTIETVQNGLKTGSIEDAEGLGTLLEAAIDKDDGITWGTLVSTFNSIMEQFPGLAKRDYVECLELLRPDVSLENAPPIEKVLRIDLLREKIYQYLSIKDKRSLRLCSRTIWELTLPTWRKTVAVQIAESDSYGCINLDDFCNLLQAIQVEGDSSGDPYLLEKYPYKNCVLHELYVTPFKKVWNKWEHFFWENYAPTIASLTLHKCEFCLFSFLDVYLWILRRGCPLLETLKIKKYGIRQVFNEEGKWEPDYSLDLFQKIMYKDTTLGVDDFNEEEDRDASNRLALNLKSLHFPNESESLIFHVRDTEATDFLRVAPNLEALSFTHGKLLGGLMDSTKFLITVVIDVKYRSIGEMTYENLVHYTATYPNSIKHIKIKNLGTVHGFMVDLEHMPHLNTFISQCRALNSLELSLTNFGYNRSWYSDLISMDFPGLTKLKICFEDTFVTKVVHFDFESLKNAPKLKTLVVDYTKKKMKVKRKVEARDWIKKGEKYFEDLFCLEELETFSFNGWPVDSEDLEIFKNWFPSLKHLTIGLDRKTRPGYAAEVFEELQSLTLTRGETHQRKLFKAKLEYGKRLRIFLEGDAVGKMEVVEGGNQGKFVLQPLEAGYVIEAPSDSECDGISEDDMTEHDSEEDEEEGEPEELYEAEYEPASGEEEENSDIASVEDEGEELEQASDEENNSDIEN